MSSTFRLVQASGEDGPSRAPARGDVGSLVLRLLDGDAPGGSFLVRRARHAVQALPRGPERHHLGRILQGLEGETDGTDRVSDLVAWAGHLESRELFAWADEVLHRALTLRPRDPELVLHTARLARKTGEAGRARALYDRVAALDDGSGRLTRMAEVGHALLADRPARALGRALRRTLLAGDSEAAAVAQEARARVRRAEGDVDGAVRDFIGAAVRYGHPADAGRIGHEVADLLSGHGDPLAARRVLLAVERVGHPSQADRARARLLGLSRELRDELGLRRWHDAPSPALVSLTPRLRGAAGPTRAPMLDRLLARLAPLAPGILA